MEDLEVLTEKRANIKKAAVFGFAMFLGSPFAAFFSAWASIMFLLVSLIWIAAIGAILTALDEKIEAAKRKAKLKSVA